MAVALGYVIEDCVFAVWTFILSVALIRNLWYERKHMEMSSKGHIIRNTNRSSVVILVLVYVLSPDFRAIRGIYSNDSILYNLIYDLIAISILFTSCSFIYFTLQSASIATAQTMSSSQSKAVPITFNTSHAAYWILPIIAVAVATPSCILSAVYGSDLYAAIWQLILALLVIIMIFVYIFLSVKLQRALMRLCATTQHSAWYMALHRRLRVYQIVLTIPACLLVVALLSFVPQNITTTRRVVRTEDSYDFTWAVWMWCALALESGFMYVAWVLPGHQSTNSREVHVQPSSRPSKVYTIPNPNTISHTPRSRSSLRVDGFSVPPSGTGTLGTVHGTSASPNNLEMVVTVHTDEPTSTVHSQVSSRVPSSLPFARVDSDRPDEECSCT